MKVRLKLRIAEHAVNIFVMFQFHEGPIKTRKTIEIVVNFLMFQFHEGPIKTVACTLFK